MVAYDLLLNNGTIGADIPSIFKIHKVLKLELGSLVNAAEGLTQICIGLKILQATGVEFNSRATRQCLIN